MQKAHVLSAEGCCQFCGGYPGKAGQKIRQETSPDPYEIYNLARNNEFDSTKARQELGYTSRPYRETIHDEIAWLKQTHKI